MNNQLIVEKVNHCLLDFYQKNTSKLNEGIRYSIQAGGKRFRPILLVNTLEALNYPISDDVIKVGAALEMIHTSSLIHDDLPAMDNDDYRRGKLTNHKLFGDANAILAGDALLLDPFQLICNTNFSAEIIVKLVRELSLASGNNGMVLGQSIDINSENQQISDEQLKELHAKKTGAMITFPFIAASIIADVSTQHQAILKEIGMKIGLAFQIRDDIIDVTESFEILGKTPKKDIVENKATYVSHFGLEQSKILLKKELHKVELLIDKLDDFNGEKLESIINLLKLKEN